VLPAGARQGATVSIAQTQVIAARLGPAGARLMTAASSSFVAAMHVAALISVVIAAAGAVAIAIWMPGRKPRLAEGAAAETALAQGGAVASGGALDG